ncbi:MAG: 30S ribosomal protein S16 [Cytophagales bacterium]|nr:30S ribosomal protein S16 [Cytophagales bacterium]
MSVKIRLARRGRKRLAIYDVVVADSKSARNGRFIEKLGQYNPNTQPETINIDTNKALDWVLKGALPTDTTRGVLAKVGVMFRKHLQVGVNKGAITQEQADAKFATWQAEKQAKVLGVINKLSSEKASKAKARLENELKVKEAKFAAIEKKNKVAEPEVEAAAEEAAPEVEASTEAAAE